MLFLITKTRKKNKAKLDDIKCKAHLCVVLLKRSGGWWDSTFRAAPSSGSHVSDRALSSSLWSVQLCTFCIFTLQLSFIGITEACTDLIMLPKHMWPPAQCWGPLYPVKTKTGDCAAILLNLLVLLCRFISPEQFFAVKDDRFIELLFADVKFQTGLKVFVLKML